MARFPEIAELARQADPEIQRIEAELDLCEAKGVDASCLRQILRELRWRVQCTADADGIRAALARLHARAASAPAHGIYTDVWFLQLDACVDRMLADDFVDDDTPPCLLDRINDPVRLKDYLESLQISRFEEDGIDRRKELNLATANLVRLILWNRPRDYPWDSRLVAVIRRFVAGWQDPTTGFFGADYLLSGQRLRTADLSLTFHMARYLNGEIGYWPQLIDTLFAMHDQRYPNGWLDEIGLTSHNNYDVAVLLQFGWPHMDPGQRRRGGQELGRLLDWCLTTAISPDGDIVARASGESLAESHYFTIAFLDTVGYFDPVKRFWSARDFPEGPDLRARLEDRLARLPQGDPMVRMAHERLRPTGG